MDDRGQQFTRILSAGSLLFALVIGSYLLFDRPFQSERVASGLSPSILESRLWEDPFTPILALEALVEQNYQSGSSVPPSLYKQFTVEPGKFSADLINLAGREEPVVLGVLLPGGRFALSSETRRRTRYAVISALNQTHIPVDSEAISILCLSGATLNQPCASPETDVSGKLMLSYEIFAPYVKGGMQEGNAKGFPFSGTNIIVLWIPENVLGTEISKKYSAILSAINIKRGDDAGHVLLGPTNSNVLVDLIGERCNATCNSTAGAWTEPVQDSIDRLIANADSYLDNGMLDEKRLALEQCFAALGVEVLLRAQVADCLTVPIVISTTGLMKPERMP